MSDSDKLFSSNGLVSSAFQRADALGNCSMSIYSIHSIDIRQFFLKEIIMNK